METLKTNESRKHKIRFQINKIKIKNYRFGSDTNLKFTLGFDGFVDFYFFGKFLSLRFCHFFATSMRLSTSPTVPFEITLLSKERPITLRKASDLVALRGKIITHGLSINRKN